MQRREVELSSLGMPSAVWRGAHFHWFEESFLKRLRSVGEKWQVRSDPPALVEIHNACVSPVSLAGTRRHFGVYNQHSRVVTHSVPRRGPNYVPFVPPNQAEFDGAKLDSRSVYFLGYAGQQYGHFLLESLSRAWAWRAHGGGLVPIVQNSLPTFGAAYLNLVDGMAEAVEEITETTRFARVVIPAAAFAIGREARLEFANLCGQISRHALPRLPTPSGQPVYLSRRGLGGAARRTLVGEDRLERLLEDEGFLIVRPETLSVVDQIGLFNRHKWIVTPIGSACHTKLFTRHDLNLLMLTGDEVNANFLLCDFITPGASHYANVLFTPDIGMSSLPRMPVPLMLDEGRLLTLLKGLGLVRSKAQFATAPPDADDYKKVWVSIARHQIRKKTGEARSQLECAIERVRDSLGPSKI